MELHLLQADTPNSNGRIYSKEVLEQIKNEITERVHKGVAFGIFVEDAKDLNFNLADSAFRMADPRIEDGFLKVDVIPLSTPKGELLKQFIKQSEIYPVGTGVVDEYGHVTDYQFHYATVSCRLEDPKAETDI